MGGRTGTKAVGKRGEIGQQIFDQVEHLTANGAMKKLDAFKQLASTSGRQLGTVAANYYRVARQRGVALRPRRGSARGGGGSATRALSALAAALRDVSSLIEARERELATLQKENRRMGELRRLLSR